MQVHQQIPRHRCLRRHDLLSARWVRNPFTYPEQIATTLMLSLSSANTLYKCSASLCDPASSRYSTCRALRPGDAHHVSGVRALTSVW